MVSRKTVIRAALVLAVFICLNAGPMTAGGVGQKERHFVFDITAYTAATYVDAFCPPSEGTIYIIADKPSVFAPLETMVYYWPITKEYKADWAGLNQPVQGTLEIVENEGKGTQGVSLVDHALEYSISGDGERGMATLHLGSVASQRRAEFERAWSAYPDESARYQTAMQDYAAKLRAGQATPENEPKAPEPFSFMVSPVRLGYVVNLPAGNYRIRVRTADGKVVPESEKKLVVFASRREGIGYVALPEAKWTTPLVSDDPDDQLYAPDGTILYLQPFREQEFNELYFSKLVNPQSYLGSPDRWVWVHTEPLNDGKVVTLSKDRTTANVERKDYYVRQTFDSGLGYEVLEWSEETLPGRTPTFSGYRIAFRSRQGLQRFSFVDTEGHNLEGSVRHTKSVDANNQFLPFLPALIPLVFAVGLVAEARQRKVHRARCERSGSPPVADPRLAP